MSNKFTVDLPVEFYVDYNIDGNIMCKVNYSDLENKINEYIISVLENYNNSSKDTEDSKIKYKKDSKGIEHWFKNGYEIHREYPNGESLWYDDNGYIIYAKDPENKYEIWNEYDENGNCIHHRDSNGHEYWKEYNEKGNLIHFKNSDGKETWFDDNGKELKEKE